MEWLISGERFPRRGTFSAPAAPTPVARRARRAGGSGLPAARLVPRDRSDAEQLLERPRSRGDRLHVGALLGLVLGGGEAVAGAAVDLDWNGTFAARSSCT